MIEVVLRNGRVLRLPVGGGDVGARGRSGRCPGRAGAVIPVPSGAQVWLAAGHTDMCKGFDGLALLVQETLKRNPHNGHLFVFRGRRGSLIKVLWHDGQGMCLFAKRLERAGSCRRRPRRAMGWNAR